MKFVLPKLKLGQKLLARVEESLPGQELLLNCQGDLIRVANDTSQVFAKGQKITVRVTAVNPLQFKLVPQKSRHSLDISI